MALVDPSWRWTRNQPWKWKFKCTYICVNTIQISQTRASQAPLLSPYNWAQCCYCIHQWKRPTFCPHQYRTNIVQTPQPLFRVKGAVLKVDGAVDLGSVSNEIFNEPMFCAVGQLLATLLGFVEGHLGWMSPFSCIVEEYHDNVAWCHSCRSSLKQGDYCSKSETGWGGILRLCNGFDGKQDDYCFILEAICGKKWAELGIMASAPSTLEILIHYVCLFILFVRVWMCMRVALWVSYNVQYACYNKMYTVSYCTAGIQKQHIWTC